MFLKTSITTTKKLCHKTLESFKSLLSGGYQRLPKSPSCRQIFSCSGGVDTNVRQSYIELDNSKKKGKKKNTSTTDNISRDEEEVREELGQVGTKREKTKYARKRIKESSNSSRGMREERSSLVAQKLKELKMLEKGNKEHALEIDEVLHYYSRLTCPVFVEIVDKFFMEMYSEIFTTQATAYGYNSKMVLHD